MKIQGIQGLNWSTFNSLLKRGWIEKLGTDDLKSLWDITSDGIQMLQDHDPRFAEVTDHIAISRLESTTEEYGYDGLGLISRQKPDPEAPPAVLFPYARKNGIVALGDSFISDALDRVLDRAPRLLARYGPADKSCASIRDVLRPPLHFMRAYVNASPGGVVLTTGFDISGSVCSCRYIHAKSLTFDGGVSLFDSDLLKEPVEQFLSQCRIREAPHCHVSIDFRLQKARKKKVSPIRLNPDLEFASLAEGAVEAWREWEGWNWDLLTGVRYDFKQRARFHSFNWTNEHSTLCGERLYGKNATKFCLYIRQPPFRFEDRFRKTIRAASGITVIVSFPKEESEAAE